MNFLRRLKRWQHWTALAVALVGAAVIAWHVAGAQARRELEAAKAAFAAHGFPTRLEEILPPVAEEDNADALLREAWAVVSGSTDWEASAREAVFKELITLEYQTKGSATDRSHPTAAGLAELRRLAMSPEVQSLAEALRRAVQKPAWRPGFNVDSDLEMLLPTSRPIRDMVQILCRRALGLAQDPTMVAQAWADL